MLTNDSKRNAMSAAMWRAIPDAVTGLADNTVRAIVLQGARNTFCAGADIAGLTAIRGGSPTNAGPRASSRS
ncbi:enoyl-CoA hydratase/isomerase family protein [Prauserella flavalba]|uniref:Enoyl-CoA hydratase/isomerase family protein n=1 Tax=Prauserella flavalba TaxID=1477506 RepID=A0A318M4U5_9PSEU|nr:enoyl-CoA hydratase/isomerase family protein [Prauserella flavalba]PXY26501.1 hypothetical protein BA062_24050 [Prauserella flavalba]